MGICCYLTRYKEKKGTRCRPKDDETCLKTFAANGRKLYLSACDVYLAPCDIYLAPCDIYLSACDIHRKR